MNLATLTADGPDGMLVVVSADRQRWLAAGTATLQQALEQWEAALPGLEAADARLDAGEGSPLEDVQLAAPLPRAWQWLDGSAFESHGRLMQRAFRLPPMETDRPLMYQGMSHSFLGPYQDVPLPSEDDGIDFEGEFGVITDAVPMGIAPADALARIRLVVMINDWSLRTIAPVEMKTGFGWVQAKPACSMAGIATTPAMLGPAWRDGRVQLPLEVQWNGAPFGRPEGGAMAVGFHELIAHAARTRSLPAGTIIGSGTVSNDDPEVVGSTCIAERRALEMADGGSPTTAFMRFGDEVRMQALGPDGTSPFGMIRQRVVRAHGTA